MNILIVEDNNELAIEIKEFLASIKLSKNTISQIKEMIFNFMSRSFVK